MRGILSWLATLRKDAKAMRQLYLITLITLLFAASIMVKHGVEIGKYIIDDNGQVVGIERRSLEHYEEYPVRVVIHNDDGDVVRDLVVAGGIVSSDPEAAENEQPEDASFRMQEIELHQMLAKMERSGDSKIMLPKALSDGSTLTWQIREHDNSGLRILLLMYVLLIGLVFYSRRQPTRKRQDMQRTAILQGLPRFVNQLVMLMHAGVILSDAFDRICDSYMLIPEERRSGFEQDLIRLSRRNREHRVSTAVLINELAGIYNIKELLRITTILMENERRGSDVVDNLMRESRFLWEERKIIAAERGRRIDAKMAYPLGLLLLMLIVITMAPAILAM